MKRIISISVFLLLVISLVPAGYPCEGKFLGIQDLRGMAPAIRSATILLYKAPKQMPLALKRMGHKVKIVKDTAALLTALKSRKNLDLVLGEVEELRVLKEKLAAANPTTSVVPIIAKKSKEKLMQTRKEFSCVVSPSGGLKGLIREINRAIKLKDRATKKKATGEKAPAA